ncbi:hypothetical protein KAH27_08385, partial [bacterium]|nr:hypothetical protein [bacterium]
MKYLKKIFIYYLMLTSGGLITMCSFPSVENSELKPTNLRCEYLKNPQSINNAAPSLSWVLPLSKKTPSQQAYQILVSTSPEKLKAHDDDLWDSGKTSGGQSQHIKYMGKMLKSGQQVYWKARIWNQDDQASEWSGINSWGIGKLNEEDWQAKWIAKAEDKNPDSQETDPAPYFRKDIKLNKSIKSARVYVSGLGYYEL